MPALEPQNTHTRFIAPSKLRPFVVPMIDYATRLLDRPVFDAIVIQLRRRFIRMVAYRAFLQNEGTDRVDCARGVAAFAAQHGQVGGVATWIEQNAGIGSRWHRRRADRE